MDDENYTPTVSPIPHPSTTEIITMAYSDYIPIDDVFIEDRKTEREIEKTFSYKDMDDILKEGAKILLEKSGTTSISQVRRILKEAKWSNPKIELFIRTGIRRFGNVNV